MNTARAAIRYARANEPRFVDRLRRFVRFASVSAQPARAGDVRACARWLAGELRAIGMPRVALVVCGGHPIVCAATSARLRAPILLVYGHYDVQPADPIDDWRVPPFAGTRRGELLFGRGASDDKGQLLAHVNALESYLTTFGSPPLDIVCLFEGEEEIGSPSLATFAAAHPYVFHVDAAVVSDTTMLAADRPALTYGLRGEVALEMDAHGPARELHSGKFGGAVSNPLQTLCAILASLHDRDGRVSVAGFYDRVDPPGSDPAGPSDREFLHAAGSQPSGEREYSLHERATARPALTITAVHGGYSGKGAKAVIPAQAVAKLDTRLVPRQEPDAIASLIGRHVAARTPEGLVIDVRTLAAARPVRCDPAHPSMWAAQAAYERGFGVQPALIRSGGTIPIAALLQERLQIPTVLMGFGLPTDRIHAPNEHVHLPTLARATETCIWFFDELAGSTLTRVSRPMRATAVR
jgi:acetylornithine deacetylase/succinyl-diaminopimelate desuccinylase-like protein